MFCGLYQFWENELVIYILNNQKTVYSFPENTKHYFVSGTKQSFFLRTMHKD